MSVAAAVSKTTERLRKRKANYQLVFGSPAGQEVLKDMARFCRAAETTIHPMQNARTHAMLDGRRQVWLRIYEHLNFTPEELLVVYRAAVLDPTGEQDG